MKKKVNEEKTLKHAVAFTFHNATNGQVLDRQQDIRVYKYRVRSQVDERRQYRGGVIRLQQNEIHGRGR
jgi:hypothetical protein